MADHGDYDRTDVRSACDSCLRHRWRKAEEPGVAGRRFGVENFNKVRENLYRSSQPGAEGFRELQRRGVKTVINLRDNHDDKDEARGTKLRLVRVKMDSWDIEDRHVARVLAMPRRKEDGPLLVHCWHGSDRTGLISAMYRMVEQRWSREEAIHELRDGGYGFHREWKNIIRYLERVDVGNVRRRVERLAAASLP